MTTSGKWARALDWLERTGNRMPDPATYFLVALGLTIGLSAWLAPVRFSEIDPRTGQGLVVHSQLTGPALATFLSRLVTSYTSFAPLGLVMVMVLGVGVAEESGLIGVALQSVLKVTPVALLTPALALAGVLSHVIADAAVVAVVPLGGALFYAAGRHPLAGIMVTYASILGCFTANLLPTPMDPLFAGFTQAAARLGGGEASVNPLCNLWFTAFLCVPLVLYTWWLTDRVIEPRLAGTAVDGDPEGLPRAEAPTAKQRRALWWAAGAAALLAGGLAAWAWPADSALRDSHGSLAGEGSALMRGMVPVMFLCALVPGLTYGYAAGVFRNHRDVIGSMAAAMSRMGYYLVLVFFASLFIQAFTASNLGALLALKGGMLVRWLALPVPVTLTAIVLLTCTLDLVVGSASAKWAILAPIFVPMLMSAGIAPELTQLAYRVGDGPNNIVSPLSPYFPLVVAFSVRYVRSAGVGTALSLLLPYAVGYLVLSVAALAAYRALGLPLGL